MAPLRFLILAVGVCFPLLIPLGINLWSREAYQFFPFAWGVGTLLWLSRMRSAGAVAGEPVNSYWALAPGMSAMVVSLLLWSPWIGGLGFILLLAGYSVARLGWISRFRILPPLLLLLLTLPLPLKGDEWLLIKLKQLAVLLSSRYLDLYGIIHLKSGSLIELPTTTLLVEEACSGINSFLSLLAAALFIVVMERRTWWHSLLVVLFSVIMVVAANVLRICTGAVFKVRYDIDLLNGAAHQWTGLIVFLLTVLAIWSFDRLMAGDLCVHYLWQLRRYWGNRVPCGSRSSILGARNTQGFLPGSHHDPAPIECCARPVCGGRIGQRRPSMADPYHLCSWKPTGRECSQNGPPAASDSVGMEPIDYGA